MYLEDRAPIADLVAPILEEPTSPVVISTITLAEVLVAPARHPDQSLLATVPQVVLQLPNLRVAPLTDAIAVEAAVVRAQTGLPLPDSAIIATARNVNASALLGNDRRWRGKPLGIPYYYADDIVAR